VTMDGLPPICPVACPNPEKTGAGGALGAATAGAGETKDFPMREGLPPICPVACPKPEKLGIGPETTGAGAAAGGAAGVAPLACPNPEKPGTPEDPAAWVAG
jgi:hypothetical protein